MLSNGYIVINQNFKRKKNVTFFICILLIIFASKSFCQAGRDSIERKLNLIHKVDEKLLFLDSLTKKYLFNEPGKAIIYSKYSIDLINKHDAVGSNVQPYRYMANAYSILGDYEQAFELFQEALYIEKEIKNNKLNQGLIHNDIAVIYLNLGDYDKSIQFFKKAIRLFEQINDSINIIKMEGNIAIVKTTQGKYNEAIEIITKQLFKFEQNNDTHAYLVSVYNLADLYIKKGQYRRAINYLEEGLRQLNNYDNNNLKINFLLNEILPYCQIGEYSKALEINDSVAKLINKYHFKSESLLNLYDNYSLIYSHLNDYKNAFKYQKQFNQIQDSVLNEMTKFKIDGYKLLYENKKRESELSEYQNKIQLLKKQNKINQFVKWGGGTGVILLIVIVFLIIRNYRLHVEKVNQEIVSVSEKALYQGNQLEKLALKMVKNQNFLSEIKKDIKIIKSNTSDDKISDKINELFLRIQSASSINKDKAEFQVFLDKTVQDFSYRLQSKFPELSEDERNICIYIHLGLKTKDIASIMNVSLRSIENKRYRIRKKMNLDSADQLSDLLGTL